MKTRGPKRKIRMTFEDEIAICIITAFVGSAIGAIISHYFFI